MERAHDDTVTDAPPAGPGTGAPLGPATRWWMREARRPRRVRDWPRGYWLAVAAVCVGACMGQLDASIVTLALPTLERQFHAGIGAVTWVGLSYLVVLVATVAAVGRVADLVGRKLVYLYGFVVFIAGSALCAAAPNLATLDLFRCLQALGAAMLQANSVAIIAVSVPGRVLGRAIGVQGAAQAGGLALGPTVGGLLVAAGGWRLIFLVNVPLGVIGLVAGWLFIPRSRHLAPPARFDWRGLALFVPAVTSLLVAVSFGDRRGWLSPGILGLFGAAGALTAGFVRHERRTAAPMIDLGLFSRRPFAVGIAGGLLSYLVMFGTLFAVPFLLERGLVVGPARSGLELMVMPLALAVAAPLAGRAADRVGVRPLTVGGMAAATGGLAAMAVVHGSALVVCAELAVVGAGLGTFTAPNNASVMASVDKVSSGMASGVLNMTRGLGTALGLALTGLVFTVAGGEVAAPAGARGAFAASAGFLAVVAAVAALVASRAGRPDRRAPGGTGAGPTAAPGVRAGELSSRDGPASAGTHRRRHPTSLRR